MIVKTFTGASVRETLQMVRDAFGADAVILETRVEEGGARRHGLPAGSVAITAATEPQRSQAPGAEGARSLHLKGTLGEAPTPHQPAEVVADLPAAPPAAEEPAVAPAHDQLGPILRELQGLRRYIQSAAGDDTLWETMRRWLSTQPSLSTGIVDTFASSLVESLPPQQPFLTVPAKAQTVLAVGARGVGKSAFLFKGLAARWQAVQRKPGITVISAAPDHGHERLQALSVGCGVEFSAWALGQSRRPRAGSDSNDETFAEYVVSKINADHESHAKLIRRGLKPDVVALVLNATSSPHVWRQHLNRLAVLAPTHLVFTHWDEEQPWWEAVTFSGQSRLPLAYRISGCEAFGEIDAFTATDIQSALTDHVTRALCSPDRVFAPKEDA